jgi:REP element-mobilizing transposase RayT
MRSRNRNIYECNSNVFFITSTIVGSINVFNDCAIAKIFIGTLDFYQKRGDLIILAYVLMPSHFHLIVKVNKELTVSKCIGNVKRLTSRRIGDHLRASCSRDLLAQLEKAAANEPTGDSKVWQYRFDCFVINNKATLVQKIEYIHRNPVKAGLVESAEDWNFSIPKDYSFGSKGLLYIDVEWRCLK